MGLDISNADILERGGIINASGQYVRLRGGRLLVSREWPGATSAPDQCGRKMLSPVMAEVEAALAEAEFNRKELLRFKVRNAVLTGGSMAFGYELSDADMDIALPELLRAIDWVTDTAENPPTRKEVMEFLPSLQPLMKQQAKRERDAVLHLEQD